ncbi:sensor histidine kinase [Spirosoma daeguense]
MSVRAVEIARSPLKLFASPSFLAYRLMSNSIFKAFHRFMNMNQLSREDHSGERLQREIDKILVRASVVTGLFMGLISLLFFEVIDARPESKVALFAFGMAFLFTMLIWMFNIYINNRRGLPFVYQLINPDYEFLVRVLICLLISEGMIRIWTTLDVFYQMENTGTTNFAGVLQVRGLLIVAFSLLTTWGVEKALAQQQAMGLITKLKEENFQAKYEVLKQQINPHFLFNSLNILKGMIRTGNEDAEEYLIKLADVYRYILQSNAKQDVVMADELVMLESYHFMLKNRFRDAVDLTITLSPETRRSVLPPLTLQMLMENCVKHNVLTQNRKLYVSVTEQDGLVLFQNNLQPKQSLQSSNHVGLENLARRYEHLCGTPLRVEQDEKFFTVYLPIIPPKRMDNE